jgi:3-phenylpropionate/trans-cinnamate dioxygenase ferredoxin subunit
MSWVQVATTGALRSGAGFKAEVDDQPIALFLVGDTIYALSDRCSHAEASLSEGEVFGEEVECPRHGSSFDLRTGRPLSLPATRPVAVYEVKVEGDAVFIWMEDR